MLNKVQLIGRLGQDPEVKEISSGNTLCRFSLATSQKWKDKDGNAKENTEWSQIVVWGKLAEVCGKYLYKGSLAFIDGRLQTRSWEDKSGQKKYTTEVIATDVIFLNKNETAPTESQDEMPF